MSENALRNLIEAADEGEWHSSEDCRIESRYDDCDLCKAIRAAKETLPDAWAYTDTELATGKISEEQ